MLHSRKLTAPDRTLFKCVQPFSDDRPILSDGTDDQDYETKLYGIIEIGMVYIIYVQNIIFVNFFFFFNCFDMNSLMINPKSF